MSTDEYLAGKKGEWDSCLSVSCVEKSSCMEARACGRLKGIETDHLIYFHRTNILTNTSLRTLWKWQSRAFLSWMPFYLHDDLSCMNLAGQCCKALPYRADRAGSFVNRALVSAVGLSPFSLFFKGFCSKKAAVRMFWFSFLERNQIS